MSLHGQLLWREFFYTAATRNHNFDRMFGNPICVQVRQLHDLAQEAVAKRDWHWKIVLYAVRVK